MRISWRELLALSVVVWLSGCRTDVVIVDTSPFEPEDSPPPAGVCDVSSVQVSVVPGTEPIFDWSSACTVALFLVEHRASDQWGITTDESTWNDPSLANLIAPPVQYGEVPSGADQLDPAPPEVLQPGVLYDVVLWRAMGADDLGVCPQSADGMCLIALHEFYADRPLPSQPQIAFWSDHDGQPSVYVMGADGTDVRKLTDDSTLDFRPVWSPSGLRIVFASGDGPSFTLHVMPESGVEVLPLGVGGLGGHDWSPDGSRIVFASDGDLYETSATGSGGLERLTDTSLDESDPAWAPDGTRIAFAEVVVTPTPQADIFVLDADGQSVPLTEDEWFNVEPAWSPDGASIAYASWRDPDWEVRVMDADGSNSVKIANGQSPAWSPDGTHIVFADPDGGLFTVAADGSGLERLTDFGRDPDWSN